MKLLIDECLSPSFARMLAQMGYDAVHPRDIGRLQDPDHVVLRRAIDEDRVIITENGRDFIKLVRKVELHPGLIVLPNVAKTTGAALIVSVLEAIASGAKGRPEDEMVNRIVMVSQTGEIAVHRAREP